MRKIVASPIAVIILLIFIGAGSFFGYKYYLSMSRASNGLADSGKRQAVFLANGQVYFGYLSRPDKQVVKLTDIYYLKAQDLMKEENQDNKKLSIIKLGNELHGPESAMYINRDQILFYETMRGDSQINQAIKKAEGK